MAGGGERRREEDEGKIGKNNYEPSFDDGDFYGVLGLHKECSVAELRCAYKKLAMRWHPDRCSGSDSGDTSFVEEAKQKFQSIQRAYSVLSDANKRFLYDVGIYDTDDDDNNHGMGEFLSEMATIMSQTKPNENGGESFEELQVLFNEMFQDNIDPFAPSSMTPSQTSCSLYGRGGVESSSCSSTLTNKRNSSHINLGECRREESTSSLTFDGHFQSFCVESPVSKRHIKRSKESRGGNQREMSSNCSSRQRR